MLQRGHMELNISDIFITFADCYKPLLKVNGKEKNSLRFSGNYTLYARK